MLLRIVSKKSWLASLDLDLRDVWNLVKNLIALSNLSFRSSSFVTVITKSYYMQQILGAKTKCANLQKGKPWEIRNIIKIRLKGS